MKNRMLNFQGVALSVSFDREKAEPIVENISKGCLNESYTPDPDELINSLTYMSECDKSHFIDKLDTSLTGDYIKEQEHLIDEEILDDYNELQNIMRLMYAYEALQSGDIDLVKSAVKKLIYYFNSEFQRDNSEELLNEYVDKLSEDDMKNYLNDFILNNLETSTFFSAALMAKKEEENNRSRSSSGYGGGSSQGYTSVPTVKAKTNEQKEEEKTKTPENVKTTEEQKGNDGLKSEKIKKESEKQSQQTKKDDKIKQDFLNSSTDKNKQNNNGRTSALESIKNTITSGNSKNLSNSVSEVAEKGIDSVKDLIANGSKVKNTIDGKLSSSISKVANKGIETIKPIVKTTSENMGNSNAVLPGVAGLSTAAVAGLGTKLYIDKKDDKKYDKKEEKVEVPDNTEEEKRKEKEKEKETLKISSKEDILKLLER